MKLGIHLEDNTHLHRQQEYSNNPDIGTIISPESYKFSHDAASNPKTDQVDEASKVDTKSVAPNSVTPA